MARGLGRAARDALASSPLVEGARYQDFSTKRVQLPVPYQDSMLEVEKALMRQHFEPGNVVLGGFDHLTFGVPAGFYHLVVGTGQGASSLARGRYEQATRELAPSALLVALYAGGRVQRVRLIYEGGKLVPSEPKAVKAALDTARGRIKAVEVSVQ